MQTATFFSPASAALLRGLLSFADPPALAALEAASGLFGGGVPSLVELAVRDALGAAGLPQGLADARLAGESWARLLCFVLVRVAAGQQRHTIGAGALHSLVAKDGVLFSFGHGGKGQLGHGDAAIQLQPKQVKALAKERVVGVAAGMAHSLVLTAEGALFSFGHGMLSQLGHSDTTNQPRPKQLVALAKERVVSMAAGMSHSLVLTTKGALFSFGYAMYGQLGHGDNTSQQWPKRVAVLAKERIVSVAAGTFHSLALTAEGTLFSFGWGQYGQLGHGDATDQLQPKRVLALAKEKVVGVAAGSSHSLALTAGGALFSFGHGANGALGHGDTADQRRPKRVAALSKERVVSVAAGTYHSQALTAEGALFSFGGGWHGQLGHGADKVNQPQPKRVAALAKERIVGVAAGNYHSLALTVQGALFGGGANGQLGHGDTATHPWPKRVAALSL